MAIIEYAADVDGGLRHAVAYRTDVLTAWDGSEQRVSLAARSRERYQGTFVLLDSEMGAARSLLSRVPAGEHDLALRHEAVTARQPVTGPQVEIDATFVDWAVVGRRVLLEGPAVQRHAASITAIAGGAVKTLALDAGPAVVLPAGATFVIPLEPVRLEDGQALGRYPRNLGRWEFTARATDPLVEVGTGAMIATFAGLPVLDRRPMVSGLAQEQVLGGVEFLDAGAAITSATAWARSKIRRSHEWLLSSPAERQWWKRFLRTVRGRWKHFLLPTWQPDLTLFSQPPDGAEVLLVRDDYLGDWFPSVGHRRLQIEYANGEVSHIGVVGVSPGIGYQELDLGGGLPDPLPAAVSRVSFLETVRFDADEVAFEYRAGGRARIGAACVVLEAG